MSISLHTFSNGGENIMRHTITPPGLLVIFLFAASAFTTSCSSDSGTSTSDNTGIPSITTTDENGATSIDTDALDEVLDTYTPPDDLSPEEIAGLVFMREEEKLARDVYLDLYADWGAKVFDNISQSEQTHTDAMLALLEKYAIPDPVGSNGEGVFTNPDLQTLYDELTVEGSIALVNALIVGAQIEEIDLIDIQKQVDLVEGNQDIIIVYENLMKGSRNHLRAFVKNLASQGVDYQPSYLSQEAYDAIINEDIESRQ